MDDIDRNEYPPGCLIVFTSDKCQICNMLDGSGFYDRLDEELELGRITNPKHKNNIKWLQADDNGSSSQAKIFNLAVGFPSFKYMTMDTFEKAMNSGNKYEQFINRTCFFNSTYDHIEKKLKPLGKYKGEYSVEIIQKFCDDSMIELEN